MLALLAVGANPLYVIYGLGGAHNDLIMLALMMAAVALTLARGEGEQALAGDGVEAGPLVGPAAMTGPAPGSPVRVAKPPRAHWWSWAGSSRRPSRCCCRS